MTARLAMDDCHFGELLLRLLLRLSFQLFVYTLLRGGLLFRRLELSWFGVFEVAHSDWLVFHGVVTWCVVAT